MSMTKSDIVEKIYKDAGFSKKEAADMVDLIFKIIKDTLARGEKVKISGFGNFSIRDKATRLGRNPQTGESMEISARRVLTFKPSPLLKDDITSRFVHRINDNGEEDRSIAAKDAISRALSSYIQNHLNIEEGHAESEEDDDEGDVA